MLHSRSPIHDPLSRATPYSVRTNIALELWRFCFFVGDNGVTFTFIFLFKFLASSSTPSAASCLIFKEPVGIVLQVETNRRVMVMM
ncbi:unnamed protein product [Rhizophagus irregularis]|uniref:Uncharacterized protein n=1 Tax=Rhizophagus irregularis TaxID=588596 RepID=A0A915ZS17_9GLOM|nr:unnamed protein product [Rhizophagus irregularis]